MKGGTSTQRQGLHPYHQKSDDSPEAYVVSIYLSVVTLTAVV